MSDDIMLKLKTNDQEVLQVPARIANLSGLIQNVIDDGQIEDEIPLPSVSRPILEKIIEFCELRAYIPLPPIQPPVSVNLADNVDDPAALEFINAMDFEALTQVMIACNYLDMKSLLGLCEAKIASHVKGHSIDELCRQFGVTEKFTPEEEARIMAENPWVMDDREERLSAGR